MPLRIGFDMDGTLADFGAAFRAVEQRLFGAGSTGQAGEPEREEEAQDLLERRQAGGDDPDAAAQDRLAGVRHERRRRDAIWKAIQGTPNFWETLEPLDNSAVARIHALMLQHRWEVFFITQRPRTEGDTVQRQTQRWLVAQGFDLPSVLVLGGSRGAAAGALRLDYHVDDSSQNCLDVKAESHALPILLVGADDSVTLASARKLGIGTAQTIAAALDILEQASTGYAEPGLLAKLASIVGWR
jgi:hypothetical protein